MKQRLFSITLASALMLSLLPANALAAHQSSSVPDSFLTEVSLPLMEARTDGLYENPENSLPDPSETGFLLPVDGGEPHMPTTGLMAEVGDAPSEAVEISNAEELTAISSKGTYVLTEDIDLSETDWIPICLGNSGSHIILDGQGHTITGLHIHATETDEFGLFSYVYGNVTVRNLRLDEATLTLDISEESTAHHCQGLLFGEVKGNVTLDNITADVDVTRAGTYNCYTGGLVGYINNGSLTVNDLALTVTIADGVSSPDGVGARNVGGVAGYVSGTCTFTRCYVHADIDVSNTTWSGGDNSTGGLVGTSGNIPSFTDCLLEGTLNANRRAGGFVGRTAYGVNADNCVILANIAGTSVGGICAETQNSSHSGTSSYTNCRYSGTLSVDSTGTAYAGALVGYARRQSNITNCTTNATFQAICTGSETYLGGFLGCGNSSLSGCSAIATTPFVTVNSLYLGGMVGSGTTTLLNCLSSLVATSLTSTSGGTVEAGGMVGNSQILIAENCGSKATIAFGVVTDSPAAYLGGLAGHVTSSTSCAKCWTDGSILYTNSTDVSCHYYLGGLGGYCGGSQYQDTGNGILSQCYSGVDLSWSSVPTQIGYIGGIAGHGNSMYSCWTDAALRSNQATYSNCVGGLAGWSNYRAYRDCTFAGTMEGIGAEDLGGILGGCQIASFYNCYVEGDLAGGYCTGGILGSGSHTLTFHDCAFNGTCTARSGGGAAGIVADRSSLGTYESATLRRCEVNADITCPGGYAFGLGRSQTKAYDCTFWGNLTGTRMAGIGSSGYFYDCTATPYFTASQLKNSSLEVGGIAASASVVSNCHVTNHLYLTVNMHEERDSLSIKFGGIAGSGTKVVDCTSKGVTLSCYGDDHDLDEEKENDTFSTHVGGITGNLTSGMEDCRVSGNVSANVTLGSIYIGGVSGTASSGAVVSGCSARSSVSGHLKSHIVYAGGLLGTGTDTTAISACSAGSASATCQKYPDSAYTEHPWVGNGLFTGGSGDISIPERPEEALTIQTYYYRDDISDSTLLPLGDVSITVNGNSIGKTDSAGLLAVTREQAGSLSLTIEGEKDGYFSAERFATLSNGGTVNLYLREKGEGKIYITAATITRVDSITQTEKKVDLLYANNTIRISQTTNQYREFYFGVDWNDMDPTGRILRLTNEDGSHTVTVGANSTEHLRINDHFSPDEDIYLEAEATYDGETVTQRIRLGLDVIKIEPKIPIEGGETDFGGEEAPYLIKGVNFKIDFDDLVKYSQDIEFENGVLKIKFENAAEEDSAKTISFFRDDKVKVSVAGEVQIGYAEAAIGQWSGAIQAGINRKVTTTKGYTLGGETKNDADGSKTFQWIYNHIVPPGIPLEFKMEFSAGAIASLGIQGVYDQAEYFGEIKGEGDAELFVGLGKTFSEDVEATVGGKGKLKLELPFKYTPSENMKFTPSLDGSVYATVTLKAGTFVDLEGELKLGGFKWDPVNGTVWDNDAVPTAWVASDRTYLMSDSGFAENICLNAVSLSAAADTTVFYENIHRDSRAAMSMENGIPVLYFTADDGTSGISGSVSQHTALWRSEYLDGSWSTPTILSSSENGYPATPNAYGGYVVWVESTQTDDLDALLTSTDIKVAYNGDILHTIDGEGYVYAPKVTADSDGNVLVIWLSDSSVNGTNFLPSNQVLKYAKYTASTGAWTTGVATTKSTPSSIALDSGNTNSIYATNNKGTLYRIYGSTFGTCSSFLTGVETCGTTGAYTASISANGTFTVWSGTTEKASLELGTSIFSQPILCLDGSNVYVIWAQGDGVYYADSTDGWSCIKKVCEEDDLASRLTAQIVDGRPLVSYYRDDTSSGTVLHHLICAYAEDLSGTDLVVSNVELDSRDLDEYGTVRITGTVSNRMKTTQEGYSYTVTDETGTVTASGTVTEELAIGASSSFSILVGHDVTATHTYTIEILPLAGTDANPEDNAVTIFTQDVSLLAGTTFYTSTKGTGLEALVKNIGSAPSDKLTVKIYRSNLSGEAMGEALVTKTLSNLYPGSYAQILLDETHSDVYYKVILLDGDTELDSDLLTWSDPDISGVWIQNIDFSTADLAKVTLVSRNYTEDVQTYFALYGENGQMATLIPSTVSINSNGSRTVSFDLSAVSSGQYNYQVFVLTQNTFVPISESYIGTIIVP